MCAARHPRPSPVLCSAAVAVAMVSAAAVARAEDPAPGAAPVPVWEGAVGLMLNHSANYQGAADSRNRLVPGFFLRYGRFSATNASGFVTRRNDDVERGVAAELLRRDDLRVSLSARFDGGRDADSDAALRGLPDVRPTLRLRLSALKHLSDGWQVSAAISPDVLNRGGGVLADLGLGREWYVTRDLRASIGTGTTWASGRYLQSYFGVTPAQSTVTGMRTIQPGAGLRDLSLGAGLYAVLGPHWVGFASVGATHLLGDAADSPLTHRTNTWSAYSGVAWRF